MAAGWQALIVEVDERIGRARSVPRYTMRPSEDWPGVATGSTRRSATHPGGGRPRRDARPVVRRASAPRAGSTRSPAAAA